jgi:hypothetical protein
MCCANCWYSVALNDYRLQQANLTGGCHVIRYTRLPNFPLWSRFVFFVFFFASRRGLVVSAPAWFSGGPGIESRLFWLGLFVDILSLCGKCWDNLRKVKTASLHIPSNSSLTTPSTSNSLSKTVFLSTVPLIYYCYSPCLVYLAFIDSYFCQYLLETIERLATCSMVKGSEFESR